MLIGEELEDSITGSKIRELPVRRYFGKGTDDTVAQARIDYQPSKDLLLEDLTLTVLVVFAEGKLKEEIICFLDVDMRKCIWKGVLNLCYIHREAMSWSQEVQWLRKQVSHGKNSLSPIPCFVRVFSYYKLECGLGYKNRKLGAWTSSSSCSRESSPGNCREKFKGRKGFYGVE
ncbi:hypothetical protein PVK06_022818 [Gossypium arboreum]|uniref:Uncharacterized protein n=1 Tax=Gossypium arboreum TaxID=29729 RepID=A0ABR0P9N7_GOSAR|nr:hypothetical protein PVK06_022818 [Gossypium arboreum]